MNWMTSGKHRALRSKRGRQRQLMIRFPLMPQRAIPQPHQLATRPAGPLAGSHGRKGAHPNDGKQPWYIRDMYDADESLDVRMLEFARAAALEEAGGTMSDLVKSKTVQDSTAEQQKSSDGTRVLRELVSTTVVSNLEGMTGHARALSVAALLLMGATVGAMDGFLPLVNGRVKLRKRQRRARVAEAHDDVDESDDTPVRPTNDSADDVAKLLTTTCPTALQSGFSRPVLTTTCPPECHTAGGSRVAASVCVFYPASERERCSTAEDRVCYKGEGCAFECLRTAAAEWHLTLFTDGSVVDEVLAQNQALTKSEKAVAVNASAVTTMGPFVTSPTVKYVFVTGNEAANNYDQGLHHNTTLWYEDNKLFPTGALTRFELPPEFLRGVRSIDGLRIENIALPADLSNNPIGEIPPGTLPSVEALMLQNTGLTRVPDDVAKMPNLIQLWLPDNNLRVIENGAIPASNLEVLVLTNCGLTDVPPSVARMTRLTDLVMSGNDLSNATNLSLLPQSLSLLNLHQCRLSSLPEQFQHLTKLKHMFVSHNPLRRIQRPSPFPNASMALFIVNASFTTIPAGILPSQLTRLSLRRCRLTRFDLAMEMPWLERLDLRGNAIREFEARLPAVQLLDLRDNQLETFRVANTPELRHLQLGGNQLRALPSAVFKITSLVTLNVTRNPIRLYRPSVDEFAFLSSRVETLVMEQEMFDADCAASEQQQLHHFTVCLATGSSPLGASSNNSAIDQDDKNNQLRGTAASGWTIVLNVALVALLVAAMAAVWFHRRRSQKVDRQSPRSGSHSVWSDDMLLQHRLDTDLLEKKRRIGRGMFGEVWLATYKRKPVAVKQLHSEDGALVNRQHLEAFIDEIKLVSRCSHERIVRFLGVVWTKESDLGMVSEYMAGGDLRSYLDRQDNEQREEGKWSDGRLRLALDIAEALVYLHSLDPVVLHRDLKSRNVLLDKATPRRAKLTDFGVARSKSYDGSSGSAMTSGVGTIRWTAPEVLAGRRYNEAVDMFSLGVIFTELDTFALPYSDATEKNTTHPLSETAIAGLVAKGELVASFSASCPPEIRALGTRCMAFEGSDRPTALAVTYELRQLMKQWHSSDTEKLETDEEDVLQHRSSEGHIVL
ncbi:hypothetical protein ATCC90586_009660 [Pythium insidiosum]|nr:hypothetical protein ATCC90586_009660 [Pythium insidiosum]